MIALGGFALLRPWWLLALPVVGILVARSIATGSAIGAWARVMDPHLLAAMARRGGVVSANRSRSWIPGAVLGLIVLALTGPAIRRPDTGRFRNLDAVLVLLDLASQDARTVSQAQSAALSVVTHVAGRQLGLVLYAGDAYLAAPLTDDPATATAVLFAVDADTVPDPGARADRALAAAASILREAHILRGDVVLVSTGDGLGPRATAQARALAADGHAVHTLQLPKAGAEIGNGLADLARAGGGLAVDAADPERLLAYLALAPVTHTAASDLRVIIWQDFGRLILLAALLPLLLMFRRTA